MSVLSTMSFHLRIRAFFSPSNPQTEPIESSSQTAIRKALEPRLKMEISWNIKYSPQHLRNLLLNCSKLKLCGRSSRWKKPCHQFAFDLLAKKPRYNKQVSPQFTFNTGLHLHGRICDYAVAFPHYAFTSFKTNLNLKIKLLLRDHQEKKLLLVKKQKSTENSRYIPCRLQEGFH